VKTPSRLRVALLVGALTLGCAALPRGRSSWQGLELRDAPTRAHEASNPYDGEAEANRAGGKLVRRYCVHCHGGRAGQGRRGVPPLDSVRVRRTPPGDLFWFITNGNLREGMPSWSRLPAAQRWQIVAHLRASHAER
jgi:mono/diheme cytochrome c family protein